MEELFKVVCGTTSPLHLLLRGGAVRRYHTEGQDIQQDVAQHSWRVMVILLNLWPESSPELIRAALYHDTAEGLLGDIPAPIKRDPAVKKIFHDAEKRFIRFLDVDYESALTEEERVRLSIADKLELCLTCSEASGRNALRILNLGAQYVREDCAKLRCAIDSLRVTALLDELTP